MVLSRFFKPKWQHKNSDVRKLALQDLVGLKAEHAVILNQIARHDADPEIRRVAVKKIVGLKDLYALLREEKTEQLMAVIKQRLAQLIAGDKDVSIPLQERIQYLALLTDEKLLEHISKTADDSQVRLAVLNQIDREGLFGDIAIHDPDSAVRHCALAKISRKSTLERVYKQTRMKDKKISAAAKARLDVIVQAEEKPAALREQLRQLCLVAESLDKTGDWHWAEQRWQEVKPQWHSVCLEWQQTLGVIDAVLEERFAVASRRFEADLLRFKTQEQQDRVLEEQRDPVRAQKKALCEALETLAKDVLVDVDPPLAKAEFLKLQIATMKSTWQAMAKLSDQEERHFLGRFEKEMRNVESYCDELGKFVEARRKLEQLALQCQRLLHSHPRLVTRQIEALAERFGEIPLLHYFHFDQSQLSQIKQDLRELNLRLAHQEEARQQSIKHIQALIPQVEPLYADGKITTANKLRLEINHLMEKLAERDREELQRHPVVQKYKKLSQDIEEKQKWKTWANTPVKTQMCQEMESLVEEMTQDTHFEQDYNNIADLLKQKRDEWRNLGASEADTSQELWERFNTACNKAYEICKANFEQQGEVRKNNLAQKEQIVVGLGHYLQNTDWHNADWQKVEMILETARKEWSAIGPVDRKFAKTINQQFGGMLSELRGKLGAEREKNQTQREGIMIQAQSLVEELHSTKEPEKIIKDVVQKIKMLQGQWQRIGRGNKEQELWRKFRAFCDVVFKVRQEVLEAKDNQTQENQIKKTHFLQEMESHLVLPLEEFGQHQGKISAMLAQWDDIGPVSQQDMGPLNQAFSKLKTQYHEKSGAYMQWLRQLQLEKFTRKAELCRAMEITLDPYLIRQHTDHSSLKEAMDLLLDQWQQHPVLEGGIEKKLHQRMEHCRKLSEFLSQTAVIEAKQYQEWHQWRQKNIEIKQQFCLRLEIIADVESPPQWKSARMTLQVAQLAQKLQGEPSLLLSGRKKAALEHYHEWHLIAYAGQQEEPVLNERFLKAYTKLI